mgnify:CR=1 FL=1
MRYEPKIFKRSWFPYDNYHNCVAYGYGILRWLRMKPWKFKECVEICKRLNKNVKS